MTRPVVQVGLVSEPRVREALQRFLDLASEVDPAVTIREEPFRIVIDHAGDPLFACRPRATSVIAGAPDGEPMLCRSAQEFAAALGELLRRVRARVTATATAAAPSPGLSAVASPGLPAAAPRVPPES